MNRVGLLVFVFFYTLLLSKQASGQNISNEGTDFWAVFPTHVPNNERALADIKVYLTSKFDTEVTVTCGTFSSGPITVTANTSVGVIVPRNNSYIDLTSSNSVLSNRGIHIKVTEGKPKVSAYAHIFAGFRSAAALILPYETLGQEYYSVNYSQEKTNGQGSNFMVLIAVEDDTKLILHTKSGSSINISLPKAGDVYEYMSGREDLTGTFAEIDKSNSLCKRFAAFSGTSNVAIGDCNTTTGSDPLYQQLYPLTSIGKSYGIVPFQGQSYLYRALATEDNTRVYENGNLVATLSKGNFYTSNRISNAAFITADKNFIVSQYMYSSSCAGLQAERVPLGDPDMVILNPVEFSIKEITVFSSTDQNITERYLNILIRKNKSGTFKINGTAPNATWTVLPGNATYVYAQIPVSETSLTLSADDGFNAIAYGYGTTESYAYSAGTNLATNNYLTVVNQENKVENPNGCINQNVEFKVNLPYQADRITWTLDDSPITIPNPPYDLKTVNGQSSYVYKYPENKIYTELGEHHLEVLAHVPNSPSNCTSGDITTNYVFSIYDQPTAGFEFAETGCAKKDIVFTDKSVSNATDFGITGWLWDFGDGEISTDEQPIHQFAKEGDYTVKLTVTSGAGCASESIFKKITIYPLPKPKFTALSNTCVRTNFMVTDQSTIVSGAILNWHWDFGDGYEVDLQTAAPVVHQYATSGKYTLKLTLTSDRECKTEAFVQDVTVTELPVADFVLPDICLNDAATTFKNTSADVAGGNGTFTYDWNFGDVSSTALNPNTSTDRDGKHQFTRSGIYNVQLKITNVNGCVTLKSQQFTVNGGVEAAALRVQNENSLCSNTDVVINNLSTAIFGRITRIEIYKDYLNEPTSFETINYPTAADIHLKYTAFGGPDNRQFTIRLVAYSGVSCLKSVDKIIVLKPAPVLDFQALPSVCRNDGSIVLNQARENSGIAGLGIYSGEGVDESGNFNPLKVEAGQHAVTFTFTASNGCSSSTTRYITVNSSPTADAGSELNILTGGQVQIPATANGEGLTFNWVPAAGLDHDDVLKPVAAPDKDTDYQLTVSTKDGCLATAHVRIKVLETLIPATSFTPNGDGVNDLWTIKYLDSYPAVTVEIFNRSGQRVYYNIGYKTPFDGNFQNAPLPVGVYYYIINPKNGRKTITGPLTIIR